MIQIKVTNEGIYYTYGQSITFILDGVDWILFRSHSSKLEAQKSVIFRLSNVDPKVHYIHKLEMLSFINKYNIRSA